jgi:hypothetical protein
MKLVLISFGTNPRIVAKFQIDRFGTFGENRGETKITPSKPYRSPLLVLRYAPRSLAASVKACFLFPVMS